MSDYTAAASAARDGYAKAAAAIRADASLSPEGKARRLAEAWRKAAQVVEKAKDDFDASRRQRRGELEKQLFQLTYPYGVSEGEKAMIRADYRQALDRAERADDPASALDLLHRARLTGDHSLARAVATVAASRQFDEVLDTYTADRPDDAQAVAELRDLDGSSVTSRLQARAYFTAPARPPEVTPALENELARENKEVSDAAA